MGPNPMNNGNVFLEECRRKYELLNEKISSFSKIAVISIMTPVIFTLLTTLFVHFIAGLAHLFLLIFWRIAFYYIRPSGRINDEQFREAFYGDVYSYKDINIEEVLTWLENIMEASGKIDALCYTTIMLTGVIPFMIDVTVIICKFIL